MNNAKQIEAAYVALKNSIRVRAEQMDESAYDKHSRAELVRLETAFIRAASAGGWTREQIYLSPVCR